MAASKFVAQNFRFNVDLDESLFDVTAIPKGYAVIQHKQAPVDEWKAF